MINALQAALGATLIALMFADLVQTTLMVRGHGFLSGRVASAVWRLFLRAHARWPQRGLLRFAGPGIILLFFGFWFVWFWLGWTLVFASGDTAVLASSDRSPADVGGLLYFAGFTIITLGVGDYVPNGALWQVLTVIASTSGFFIVTMVISYVLPVISAVVGRRTLAVSIQGLGETPEVLLERAWTGRDFGQLDLQLVLTGQQIDRTCQQHLAYPLLHYFHTGDRATSLPPAIAALDDFVSVLLYAVDPEQRPPDAVLLALRSSLDGLIQTLDEIFVVPSAQTPPLPRLPQRLQSHSADLAQRFTDIAGRRRLLGGWMSGVGLPWSPPER